MVGFILPFQKPLRYQLIPILSTFSLWYLPIRQLPGSWSFKWHEEHFPNSLFLWVAVGGYSYNDFLLRNVQPDAAVQPVPAAEDNGIIAVCFFFYDRMMYPVHAGSDKETTQGLFKFVWQFLTTIPDQFFFYRPKANSRQPVYFGKLAILYTWIPIDRAFAFLCHLLFHE